MFQLIFEFDEWPWTSEIFTRDKFNTESPRFKQILGLKETVLRKICVSGTVEGSTSRGSPTNAKIPHLHKHKPKIAVVRHFHEI